MLAAMFATMSLTVASLRFLIQLPCLRLVERGEPEDAPKGRPIKERKGASNIQLRLWSL